MASGKDGSIVEHSLVTKLLPKKDGVVGKVKFKKTAPKLGKPKTGDTNGTIRSPSPDSPLITDLDPEVRSTFPTGRPMEDAPDLIICKHCKKPMLKSVAASHIKVCLQKKQDRLQKRKENKEAARKAREAREKAATGSLGGGGGGGGGGGATGLGKDRDAEGDDDNDDMASLLDGKTGKKSTSKPDDKSTSKKRKAGEGAEGEKEPKKKKLTKKEIEAAKPKMPKVKGPVDVEKQCGVPLKEGGFCARSLTCKSHSMGAKRAVRRSLPYDMLLAAYQKKNQAKQQKAAIDANAPLLDDTDPAGPIDSDEEKDLVMAAVARSNPKPLEQHILVPVRRKYAYIRMKEMLSQALSGRGLFGGGGGNGGGGGGIAATPTISNATIGSTRNTDGESTNGVSAAGTAGDDSSGRRASMMSQGGGSVTAIAQAPVKPLGPPSRKTSMAAPTVTAA
ncbi:hypothetical protein MMC25_001018 [Agyrium rufum]|nr:hypothetical protein [Agyrium rufum]